MVYSSLNVGWLLPASLPAGCLVNGFTCGAFPFLTSLPAREFMIVFPLPIVIDHFLSKLEYFF